MSIPALLHAALAEDASRPFVTFYDEATGERVELSVATFANWVAKTGNMLQDSLGADDGTTVRVGLPVHWEACVWLLACWSVGSTVTLDQDVPAEVAVVGPDGWDGEDADEVVALSLRPLGARFAEELPAGITDFNAEVLGHGDHFAPFQAPSGDTPALRRPSDLVSHDRLIQETRERVPDRARILLIGDADADRQAEAVVTALVAAGSLVLVRDQGANGLSDERRTALVDNEQLTVELT